MRHTETVPVPYRAAATMTALVLVSLLLVAGCSSPLLPDPAVKYIAFGDSTTNGPAAIQYWQYLQQDLEVPATAFAGQGQGGETVEQGLPRLEDLLNRDVYPNCAGAAFLGGRRRCPEVRGGL